LTVLNKKLVLYYDAPADAWRYVLDPIRV